MAEQLLAPDAPFRLAAPIEHITRLDDGSVVVHCVVTSETPDSQGEIVDYDAAKAAAPEFLKWAALTEMHDEGTSPGTALQLHFDDAARRIEADLHVVDPVAVRKVLSRTYKAVSMGGIKLATRLQGAYRRITKLRWDELALVTRPANPDALIAKQFILAKRAQEPDMTDPTPLDAGVSSPLGEADPIEERTPGQVAIDETRAVLAKAETGPPEGGEKRSDIPAEDFAGKDESYPIVTPSSVSDAASSIGRAGPENFSADELKTNIIQIARRKGAEFVAALPDAWQGKKARKMAKLAKAASDNAPDDADDEAGETPSEEAAETPKEEAAEEAKEPVEKRKIAKLRKRLAKQAAEIASLRKSADDLRAGGEAVLAKYGKAVSSDRMAHLTAAHDALCKAGYAGCMAKSYDGTTPLLETTSVETAATLEGAVIAKSDVDPIALIREALEPFREGLAEEVGAKLAALDEKISAQGESFAKYLKSPAGGGPASPYAPIMRGTSEVTDKASALELAATVIDDPRLREQISGAAALQSIRQLRGG